MPYSEGCYWRYTVKSRCRLHYCRNCKANYFYFVKELKDLDKSFFNSILIQLKINKRSSLVELVKSKNFYLAPGFKFAPGQFKSTWSAGQVLELGVEGCEACREWEACKQGRGQRVPRANPSHSSPSHSLFTSAPLSLPFLITASLNLSAFLARTFFL